MKPLSDGICVMTLVNLGLLKMNESLLSHSSAMSSWMPPRHRMKQDNHWPYAHFHQLWITMTAFSTYKEQQE